MTDSATHSGDQAFGASLAAAEEALVAAVSRVADEARQEADVFALVLAYSFAGPPLPPMLGLLTEAERAEMSTDEPWDAWNPAEYERFDVPELWFGDNPSLDEACEAVNEAADGNEHAILAMLNRVARRCNESGAAHGLIVYAADLEGVDIWENLAAALSPERLAALGAAGRLALSTPPVA